MKCTPFPLLGLSIALFMTNFSHGHAAEHVIKMLNKGSDGQLMVFEPAFVTARLGDTIRVVPADQGHSVETMPGMWPGSASPIKGKIGQEMVIALEQEGVYGLRCQPHYFMGMVAAIVVGKALNLEQARSVKLAGKPKAAFQKLFDQAARQ